MRQVNELLVERDEVKEFDQAYSSRNLGEKSYELTNHLGNVLAVVSDKKLAGNEPDVKAVYDYYPYGQYLPGRTSYDPANDYRHGFGGHEKDNEVSGDGNHLSFGDYGYNSRLGIRWNIDPNIYKYPSFSSYSVFATNPIMFIDPDGKDPIYAKVRGKVKTIGDDGQCGTGSYLVKGSVARAVKKATAAGEFYTGDLSESKKVMHIPTGQVQQDVQQTATATTNSGTSSDTRVEHGGHSLHGMSNALIWDPGKPVRIETIKNPDGSEMTAKTWSLTPFKIKGNYNQVGRYFTFQSEPIGEISDIKYIWHTHPSGSDPSSADFKAMSEWRKKGFTGNTFLIDVNNNRVTFFNKSVLIKVNYNDFKRMGNQENIP
jgi:hypothetical protein